MAELAHLPELPKRRGRQELTRLYIECLPSVADRLERAFQNNFTTALTKAELLRWLINDSLTRLEQSLVDAKVREAAIDAALQE